MSRPLPRTGIMKKLSSGEVGDHTGGLPSEELRELRLWRERLEREFEYFSLMITWERDGDLWWAVHRGPDWRWSRYPKDPTKCLPASRLERDLVSRLSAQCDYEEIK